MFELRHKAYVDHPVAMSRAMRSASLFLHEVGYALKEKEIVHTCGE
jgi:hypothetical protein